VVATGLNGRGQFIGQFVVGVGRFDQLELRELEFGWIDHFQWVEGQVSPAALAITGVRGFVSYAQR